VDRFDHPLPKRSIHPSLSLRRFAILHFGPFTYKIPSDGSAMTMFNPISVNDHPHPILLNI
jgi:hypothetical protein